MLISAEAKAPRDPLERDIPAPRSPPVRSALACENGDRSGSQAEIISGNLLEIRNPPAAAPVVSGFRFQVLSFMLSGVSPAAAVQLAAAGFPQDQDLSRTVQLSTSGSSLCRSFGTKSLMSDHGTLKTQLSSRGGQSFSGGKTFGIGSLRKVIDWIFDTTKVDGYDQMQPEEKDTAIREWRSTIVQRDVDKFATIEANQILGALGTHAIKGLSSEEAQLRLEQFGRNELAGEEPKTWCGLFLEQMEDILVIMLIVAAIVAAALQQVAASVAIIVIVMANAYLGVQQEMSAASALDELSAQEGTLVTVIRDGAETPIDVAEIVPGDIVLLKLGERIPADIRLLEANDFTVKEMNLTGESRPVKKNNKVMSDNSKSEKKEEKKEEKKGDAGSDDEGEKALVLSNFIYSSCDVLTGKCKGVAVKTGEETYVGKINMLIRKAKEGNEAGPKSPLKEKLEDLGKKLGFASLAISVVVFCVGVFTSPCRGCDPDSDQPAWLQMLLVSVSLTVAAVPESLPVCVTLTLALGMQHMAKKKALVRKLISVETLGSANVICTDKTGTLTAGMMTAVKFMTGFQTYKITGAGRELEGYHVKADVDTTDEEACKNASEKKENSRVEQVWASYAMVSNAKIFWEEKKDTEGGDASCYTFEGDPTETALVIAARKLGVRRNLEGQKPDEKTDDRDMNTLFKRIKENPFNSNRKMMSVLLERTELAKNDWYESAKFVALVKGGSDQVLKKCINVIDESGKAVKMTPELKQRILEGIDGFAGESLRVLAVAYKSFKTPPKSEEPEALESDLTLLGFAGLMDPVRPGVNEAIKRASGAGIKTVMITGDYAKTAKAIAKSIGLLHENEDAKDAVITCDVTVRPRSKRILEIQAMEDKFEKEKPKNGDSNEEALTNLRNERETLEEEMDNITRRAKVFSRAKPEDKLIIVQSYRRCGNVCGMTGDGVNDGPALQEANIGIAMGFGTDVAKGASDMILTDNNYCSIVDAVSEGRTIYCNITKFVYFLLSTNVAEVFLILFASIIGLPSPLLPVQILWLNLTTDGFPAVALATENPEPNVMKEGPRARTEPVIEKVMITGVVIQTIVLTGTCLATYIIGLLWANKKWNGLGVEGDDRKKGFEIAQTMTIYHIVFAELLRAYGSRSMRESIFTIGVFSNKAMQYAVGGSTLLTLFIGHVPGVMDVFSMRYLDGRQWGLVLGLAFVPIIVDEITKVIYRATGFGLRPLSAAQQAVSRDNGSLEMKTLDTAA